MDHYNGFPSTNGATLEGNHNSLKPYDSLEHRVRPVVTFLEFHHASSHPIQLQGIRFAKCTD